ncbi:YciI family protein [Skermania piniformis]|uniref:YCII-related domain-containing protein n=1 Tax=Skermania pinensis TaxID=39122 RepID=A0ABX8S6F9_9ACTN|nr:YciI family protein [Skermania piniformis]QXQ12602.1 hypothetical protein KV203_11570 [Skermania piniformis]
MPFFAVHYRYADSTVAGRDEHRPTHRSWLAGLADVGVVRMSGPYADGSGALILVDATDADAVRRTLADDPFAKADLIEAVAVQEWVPVVGPFTT